MADNGSNGKFPARRLLAPCPCPFLPESLSAGLNREGWWYLSWAGWELYRQRRLGFSPRPGGPEPLLLPDEHSPETDFRCLDQVIEAAGDLGAGFVALAGRREAEGPTALMRAIGRYQPPTGRLAGPVLSDRLYLALWALTEYQARQSQRLLAEAETRTARMWAALKGEEPAEPSPPVGPSFEPDGHRSAYAWRCWRRLAGPLLAPADVIVPVWPEPDERPAGDAFPEPVAGH